ncbi:MAG: glycosyltransferase family 4 protein [Verrucomicrobia bacterium]|nr:glycosyltransferase family 4 protein [Verrucomicrobiota bacterium]
MLFEKTLTGCLARYPDLSFTVYCNQQAFDTLPPESERLVKRLVPWLNRQYGKTLWLEFAAHRVVNADGSDIFWIPSGANSFPGRWRKPNVVTILDVGEYFVPRKYGAQRMLYRRWFCLPRSVRRARVITTISHNAADALQRTFRLRERPRVVHPGPNPRTEVTLDRPPAEIVLEETGFRPGEFILTPGRTDYVSKGLDVLIEGFRKAAPDKPGTLSLVLVGPEGEDHRRMLEHIEKTGLSGRAHWLGRVSDRCLEALYRSCRIVVIASRYEGFGFPVLEAMQHGVPVICSDAGSLPEVAGEAEALARAIRRILLEPELAKALVAKGPEQLGRFSWDQSIADMRAAFDVATKPQENLPFRDPSRRMPA